MIMRRLEYLKRGSVRTLCQYIFKNNHPNKNKHHTIPKALNISFLKTNEKPKSIANNTHRTFLRDISKCL